MHRSLPHVVLHCLVSTAWFLSMTTKTCAQLTVEGTSHIAVDISQIAVGTSQTAVGTSHDTVGTSQSASTPVMQHQVGHHWLYTPDCVNY